MNPRYHPPSALLARYADSALATGPALVVASHLDACPFCRATVLALDETHAFALEAMPPTAMSENALQRALLHIESTSQDPEPSFARSRLGDVELPPAMAEARFHARRWMSPGLWAAHLATERQDGWRTFVLRAPANTTIPMHEHRGDELISVLHGAFHDGQTYRSGDFTTNVTGSAHDMRVEGDGPCVCLIAVRGALRWRGWSRAIGPVLGV